MNISLRQLRYFLSVADLGQIAHVAEAVHGSHPALSVQRREREQCLGITLLERQPRCLCCPRRGTKSSILPGGCWRK